MLPNKEGYVPKDSFLKKSALMKFLDGSNVEMATHEQRPDLFPNIDQSKNHQELLQAVKNFLIVLNEIVSTYQLPNDEYPFLVLQRLHQSQANNAETIAKKTISSLFISIYSLFETHPSYKELFQQLLENKTPTPDIRPLESQERDMLTDLLKQIASYR